MGNDFKKNYNVPGKSGAFYSARKLKRMLFDDHKLRVSEEEIQKWLEGDLSYSIHKPR